MTIKDKIREIEEATDELLVPEHEHHESKAAAVIGELVRETEEAAEVMLGMDRESDAGAVIGELVKETAEAAETMLGAGIGKHGKDGKLDEMAREIGDAAEEMLGLEKK